MVKSLVVLSVDPEFRDLCPPLDPEERSLLRESIAAEGCHEPVRYWDAPGNPIVDGHHRHELCEAEGKPHPIKGMHFIDRESACRWILRNQLGRRNLTDAQRSIARGRLYNRTKADATDNLLPQGSNGQNVRSGHNHKEGDANAAQNIAVEQGVNERTIRRDGQLAEAVDALQEKAPELAAAIATGALPTNAAAPLAAAPKAELKKLTTLEGGELKTAAKTVAAKHRPALTKKPAAPKAGTPKTDCRLWSEIEGYLGKAINRTDELQRQQSHSIMHRRLTGQINMAIRTLKEWKDSKRGNA
jgi:hypothetical protein